MKRNRRSYKGCGFAMAIVAMLSGGAVAQETVPYGSRAGMNVTVISKQGVGSGKAVVRTRHTAENAKKFCLEYARDDSAACVERVLDSVKVADKISGNCLEKTWIDIHGKKFTFLGPKQSDQGIFADYAIKDLQTGELLDGSNASGYRVQLDTFQMLCPGIVK